MTDLKQRMLRAHGGEQRWSQLSRLMLCVSMGGIDLASRMQFVPFRDVDVSLAVAASTVLFSPYPQANRSAGYENGRVWIEDAAGAPVAERGHAAPVALALRRSLVWDSLDVVCYAGTLLWQLLMLPALLKDAAEVLDELSPQRVGDERWHRLRVQFPDRTPSLAAEQVVYLDGTGLIRRVDYTSSLYGGLLRVSQLWSGHESFAGLVLPTCCTIHPRIGLNRPWRATVLTWLELSDLQPVVGRSGDGAQTL